MRKGDHITLTRRRVLYAMGGLALLPLAGLWSAMVHRLAARENEHSFQLKLDEIPAGISVHEKFIIENSDPKFNVFSTKCPHLGCRVKYHENGSLACPCHGSEFDLKTGSVLKGPASRPLEMLRFIVEDDLMTIYTD